MTLALGIERDHLIPIADRDTKWQQTCEIPVVYTELQIPGSATITYLRFSIVLEGCPPRTSSPLDILAGGENLEIAGQRIRTQMIHRLETGLAALQGLHPPLNASLEIQQFGQYFVETNTQPGL